jgi:hypothetical protein
MTKHTLYGKTPSCPNCGNAQDSALGGKSAPKNNSVCICAYCASITIYEVVGNVYNLRMSTQDDLNSMAQEGVLDQVYELRGFIKHKIEARKNKY